MVTDLWFIVYLYNWVHLFFAVFNWVFV